jgi:hypothetical protein
MAILVGACEAFAAGRIVRWGYGVGTPPSDASYEQIVAGDFDALALRDDGTVVAWGIGEPGASGEGEDDYGQATVPPGLTNIVAVAAGGTFSVVLGEDGTMFSWGFCDSGPPTNLSNIVDIAASGSGCLALGEDGKVLTWGPWFWPPTPPGLSNVVAIATGGQNSLVLKSDGTVVAWAPNDNNGVLDVPADLTNVVSIAVGEDHNLVLNQDGTITAWGEDIDTGACEIPAGIGSAVAVSAGDGNSFALLANGTVVAWGWGPYGETAVPTGLSNVVQIAAGGLNGQGYCLALIEDPGTQPMLTITYPADGAHLATSCILLQGRAYSGACITNVLYRVENSSGVGPYVQARGFSAWGSVATNLVRGPNLIRVMAMDALGRSAFATRTIVLEFGSLQVTLAPAGAVSAGAQWQVDGGVWQNSGATVSGLMVGNHTVAFSALTGWITPANQAVAVSAYQTNSALGTYVPLIGSLRVTISPVGAIGAGAQWEVDGGAWQNSGATVSGLVVGSHAVAFSAIAGWEAPASQGVIVTFNQTATATGAYVALPNISYATNSGAITITKYNSPGGAVTIPSTLGGLPVTSIGAEAFYSCTSVTGVTLPSTITSIGSYAFYGCTSLASVAVPSTVTNIGAGAFGYCTSLTGITISNNPAYSSLDGVLFNKGQTLLIQYPAGRAGGYSVPSGVASIGEAAFSGCAGLTSVTIPASVASIGASAFLGCTGLASAYFQGNAPALGFAPFSGDTQAAAYYLPGKSGWEATLGSLPAVPWCPQVRTGGASFGVRTNRFGFSISGTTNMLVVVEAATTLANPTWLPVGTNTLSGGSTYFGDPQWTNYPGRFYRLTMP